MGAVLEAGKQVAAAWLTEHWTSAPSLLRLILVLMIGVLMGLNAIGVFGFLSRVPAAPAGRAGFSSVMAPNLDGYTYWFHRQLDFRDLSRK
jgi:hypothetical protein